MKPGIRSLASGSSGNCYLIQSLEGLLLVDAGLSRKELLRRMALCSLDPADLKGILISHEHGDHLGCAPVLARQLGIPVFLSPGTHAASRSKWRGTEDVRFVRNGETWELGSFRIRAFDVSHDASETLQFRVECDGFRTAVCTDLGKPTEEVLQALTGCHALVLEANHDPGMLQAGPYPTYLKRRIRGAKGHLSNEQCAALLDQVAGPQLESVLLAHLSKENNCPQLALKCIREGLHVRNRDIQLEVAPPHKPGAWLHAGGGIRVEELPEAVTDCSDLPLFA